MAGSLLIDQRSLWVAETNCYIVAPEPRGPAVVVDAPPDPEGIGALLAEHDLTPIALLVTHGHIDHAGGAGGVVRATGVPAYVHPDDDFLTLHPADQLRMLFGVTISDDRAAPFAPPDRYEALADGQSLELAGLRFDVLHTPGHTPGHCCFLLRDEGILFSGDQLFAGSIGRTDLPGGDYDTLMSSMADKVLPLPENTEVLPGHGPATTLARERLINPFLQELTGREPVWALPPPGDRPPQQHRGARPMGIEPLRTVHAGDLRAADADLAVHVAGWAERIRDQGGVTFVTLRDASGIVQVVFRPDVAVGAMEEASTLKREYCIAVRGVVKPRPTGTENPDLPTGSVEIEASEIEVLSPAETLPFQLDGRVDVTEERRLQYRYLDLRTPRMATNLKNRAIAIRMMRRVLDDKEFLEVETPTLIASTPEGARDMLVPSRLRKGQFYALPQSPQLFKQLLMIGGVERYYQVARCYRDEDFRADRQVEFTQLDLEGSFWGQDDVLATLEDIAVAVVKGVRDVDLERPFPRMTYADAMARYGTDKPDIRFGMEIEDLSTVFADTEFRAFAGVLTAGGVVRGINIGSREMSRSALDAAAQRAQDLGAAGLVWMVVQPDGTMRSPVAKFLGESELGGLKDALGATSGDVLLIVADQPRVVATTLGQLRVDYGQPKGHADLEFLFVVNFPVFEVGNDGSMVPAHHAFTAPVSVEEMRTSPETAISKSYDMVLNGSELGSGSVRIHDPQVQAQVFELLGISAEDAERRFGWFLEALRYGTPPHAGFAIGVDRMVSIMQGEPNIREVIPFPKTQTGSDPLTGSPSRVETEQLGELGIEIRPEVRATWEDADTQ